MTALKWSNGKRIGVYSEVPVERQCSCPEPVRYLDEDGDEACFRCGHRLVSGARAVGEDCT